MMKVKEFQKELRKEGLGGCVLYADDPNYRYFVQEYQQSGMLFIPARGTPTVFVHPLEDLDHDFDVVKVEDKDMVSEFFEEKDVGRVGYNASEVSARKFFRLRNRFGGVRDVEDVLEGLRAVKTGEEVAHLRKAARLADDIMRNLINQFDFRTEGEIKKFLKMQMAAAGVEQSFEPIVASGEGAATPHYFREKKLREGFLIVDFGVKVKGYCSDITRTFYLGEPSREERKLYKKVLDVQKNCIEMCEAGEKCSRVFDYAKDILGDDFTHGLGHGVGLKIHELPNLKPDSADVFRDDMVFTVEPGYYDVDEEVGIRIEDDVLIDDGVPKRLTKTTKELITFTI